VPKETSSDDFIVSLVGKKIGWAAFAVGQGMLGNLLIGVTVTGTPTGTLLFAQDYGMPEPYGQPNVSIATIASETYSKPDEWKYTFLCKGCFATNPGLKAASPAGFGWAYSSRDKAPRGKHEINGPVGFDLKQAQTDGFAEFAKGAA